MASIARRRARAACAEPDVIVLDDDNDEAARDALGIKDGTVEEWLRCHTGDVPYNRDIESSLKYHRNVTANGYRALVYRSVK